MTVTIEGLGRAMLVLGVCFAACGTDENPDDSERVDYRRDVQPIWDQYCNRCHNFFTPHLVAREAGSDLEMRSWYKCNQGSDHAAFVVPGDPEASFLYYKLTGEVPERYWTEEACNRLMPADFNGGDTPLIQIDPVAVDTVRRWIEQGAQRD